MSDRDVRDRNIPVRKAYTEVSFQLPYLTLRGLRGGTPGGPLLVCLHGWLDNCHSFLPLAPYLNQYDWIALDFPGHGLSDHRGADAHYYFIDWVDDIATWLRLHSDQPVFLLGHSMGGYVAQTVAAVYPELIERLCLLEAFGLMAASAESTLEQLRNGLDSRHRQQTRKAPVYPQLHHLIKARAAAGNFSDDMAQLLLARNICEVPGGYRWRTDPRLRTLSPYRYTEAQIPAVLGGIETSVLVIQGDNGHAAVTEALARWQHLPAQVSVETVTGGHHVHMEDPQAVARLVLGHFAPGN